jgi:hypothetical protein
METAFGVKSQLRGNGMEGGADLLPSASGIASLASVARAALGGESASLALPSSTPAASVVYGSGPAFDLESSVLNDPVSLALSGDAASAADSASAAASGRRW